MILPEGRSEFLPGFLYSRVLIVNYPDILAMVAWKCGSDIFARALISKQPMLHQTNVLGQAGKEVPLRLLVDMFGWIFMQ